MQQKKAHNTFCPDTTYMMKGRRDNPTKEKRNNNNNNNN